MIQAFGIAVTNDQCLQHLARAKAADLLIMGEGQMQGVKELSLGKTRGNR